MFENLQTEIDEIVDDVKAEQSEYVIDHGKYKQYASTETDNLTYQVHESVGSKGIGFTCLFYAVDDGKEYVKTVGFGTGATSNDWTEILEDNL